MEGVTRLGLSPGVTLQEDEILRFDSARAQQQKARRPTTEDPNNSSTSHRRGPAVHSPHLTVYKHFPPQLGHTSASFEELDLVGPSSSDEDEASPPEPPKPLKQKVCPTCGKTCSHTGTLNKHVKEVHSNTQLRCRNCHRTYKT